MRFRFVTHAKEYERFAPNAFDNMIGSDTKVNGEPAHVIAAKVAADGLSVELTLEVLDNGLTAQLVQTMPDPGWIWRQHGKAGFTFKPPPAQPSQPRPA